MEDIISELIEKLMKAEALGEPTLIEEIRVQLDAAHELLDAYGKTSNDPVITAGTRVISTNRTNQPHGVLEKLLYPTSGMFAGHTIARVANDDGSWSFEYIEHVEAE